MPVLDQSPLFRQRFIYAQQAALVASFVVVTAWRRHYLLFFCQSSLRFIVQKSVLSQYIKNPQDSVVIATTEGKICFFVTKVVIGAFLGAIRVVSGWRVLDTNQTTRSRERIQKTIQTCEKQ